MIHTIKHFCYAIKVKKLELDIVLNNTNRFYYEHTTQKMKYGRPQLNRDGTPKMRTLHPSTGQLKRIQKRINQDILSKLVVPSYAFGSVKTKNNIENAKQHLSSKFFLCIDLKSFFPSITHKKVFQTLCTHDFTPAVARVLTQLTTHKGCLPQGAATSPLLANLVFAATGSKILSLIKNREIRFTTFLDDFTFSSKADFKDLCIPILTLLKEDHYWLSHNKISYKTKNPEITGVVIKNGKLIPHIRVLERQQEIDSRHLNNYIEQVMFS